MTAILNEEPPDPSTTRSGVSPALDSIVRHCLEKNPVERFQSARDIAFALESLSGSGALKAVDAVITPRRWWKPVAAIAAIAMAAAGGLWAGRRAAPAADPKFEIKTWDRATIYNARFLPDGSIAYSAAHVGMTPELFVLHPNRPTPERLGELGTHLLSVSSTGELAVLTNTRFIEHHLFRGTLARLTLGAAPRPWLEDIREADWSPDGSALAVVHALGAAIASSTRRARRCTRSPGTSATHAFRMTTNASLSLSIPVPGTTGDPSRWWTPRAGC